MKKRLFALFLAMAMIVSCLAACNNNSKVQPPSSSSGQTSAASATTETLKDGPGVSAEMVDNVVIVLPQATFDLAPYATGRPMNMVRFALYGTLMFSPYLGAPLEDMEHRIARNVTKVSDTVYDVEIYDYVHDSKGNDIKAEDVVFSYEYGNSIGRYAFLGSYMESIVATDDYTVRITLSNPIIGAIEQILNGVHIVNKDWFENASGDEKSQNPATTGTYLVESVITGSSCVLLVNEDYWQTDENLRTGLDQRTSQRLTYTVIAEMAMVSIALENGEVDIAEAEGSIIDNFINPDGTAKDGYNVFAYDVPRSYSLEYNCSPGNPLSNQYLRQAISYALDTTEIMRSAGVPLGLGKVNYDYANDAGSGYNYAWDEEDYYGYDLEKAKELFALSGYEEGLELHLLFSIGTPANTAIVIQSQLLEIGINLIVDNVESALYNTMVLDSNQWDLNMRQPSITNFITSGWAARLDENAHGGAGAGTANFVHDDELQRLLHNAMESQSAEDIDTFHYYLKEKCYVYGLYTMNKCLVAQDGILSYGGLWDSNPIYSAIEYAEGYISAVHK